MKIHEAMGWTSFFSLCVLFLTTRAQIQAPTLSESIPQNLRDCYNASGIKENLLPMTTTNFVALLRKLEEATYTLNPRLLAPAILLKYRYDGIERNPDVQSSQFVTPYARSGQEYYLYKLQMNRIIPSTGTGASAIRDDALTWTEKCTLHSMLSLSIDKFDRGDGDVPCSKLSKYSEWNARYPRDLSKSIGSDSSWQGFVGQGPSDYHFMAQGQYQGALSQCPVENGVIYDKYGSLAPGIVLAGIAAGLNTQPLPYSSYFIQPRAGGQARRKVQTSVDHYRNLFSSYQQPSAGGNQYGGHQGSYGNPGGYNNPGYSPNNPQHGYSPNQNGGDFHGGYNLASIGNGYNQPSGGYLPSGQGSGGSYGGTGYRPTSGGNGYGNSGGYGTNSGSSYGNNGGSNYGNNGGSNYGNNGGSSYGNSGGSAYGNGGVQTGSSYGNSYGSNVYGQVDIDNRYAATLAGAVSLEGLLQGPESIITIGSKGGWNSSSVPKYYFLKDWISGNVLTDARITGGLDGLYLASNIQSWTSTYGDMKISQVVDSYYSDKGVLSSDVKACNRKSKYPQFTTQLSQQAYAVSTMLNEDLPPTVILASEAVGTFSDYAATQTLTYITSLPGTQCPLNSSALYSYPYADLTVVVDCNWNYRHVAGIFNYLAEQCNLWKYGSSLTIMSGKDGSILADSIRSPLDIPRDYNKTVIPGFDFPKVLSQLKVRFLNDLQNATSTRPAGGLPQIVIFLPMTTNMGDADKSYAYDTLNYFKYNIPDVRFLYFVTGSRDPWTPFAVSDKDVILYTQGSDLAITLQPLIARISAMPRRLINPNCGRYFNGDSYNSLYMVGYLSPNEIHYYRIHPNYFFRGVTNGWIKLIWTNDKPPLTVCRSRTNPLPQMNSSNSGDVSCQQVTGSNQFQFTISDMCTSSYRAADCNPLYVSVSLSKAASSAAAGTGFPCSDVQCRFPDQTTYMLSHQGLTCYSSANLAALSPAILLCLLASRWLFGV